jgi:hypothetical protein
VKEVKSDDDDDDILLVLWKMKVIYGTFESNAEANFDSAGWILNS